MIEPNKAEGKQSEKISRRNVLKAAVAAGGAAVLGFPNIVKAQGVTTMRFQSTWPQKDIFHEFALDFAKKVNDMTGGDLKIEVLPAGAVVPAFQLLDAVSKGTLDGGHGVLSYHYGKNNALALWGSSPAYGMDANTILCLAQVRRRQGTARSRFTTRSAPMSFLSRTVRCRRSRSAGTKKWLPSPTTSRA